MEGPDVEPMQAASPQRLARSAGVFYLLVILVGMPSMLTMFRMVVPGDAAATAANLLGHESAVRLAFAGSLLSHAAYVVVVGLLYLLLRPVNREVSLIAALFGLVGCALGSASALFLEAPFLVLNGSHPGALGMEASRDIGLLFTQLFMASFDVALVFFGFYCLLVGWLVFASGFLPRLVGLALAVGGLGYLTYLWPPLAHALYPLNALPGFVAESALTISLLFFQVRARPISAETRAADAPI
jgi:hypothetical protein